MQISIHGEDDRGDIAVIFLECIHGESSTFSFKVRRIVLKWNIFRRGSITLVAYPGPVLLNTAKSVPRL